MRDDRFLPARGERGRVAKRPLASLERRLAVPVLSLLVACGAGLPTDSPPPPMPDVGDVPVRLGDDPARWFDFWLGSWKVQNLHLGRRDGWRKTGEARAVIQSVAGGNAVLERWTGEARGRLVGSSLRGWDPAAGRWEVYLNWHTGRPTGFFLMYGEREGQALHLHPPNEPRTTRYTFSELRTESVQWSDSTWREDQWIATWVMQFVRRGPPAPANAATATVEPSPPPAARFPETRLLDGLVGEWTGVARRCHEDGSWSEGTATAKLTSFIEGFGVLQFIDLDGEEHFAMLGFDPGAGGWVAIRADSQRRGLERLTGDPTADRTVFQGAESRETWQRRSDGGNRWTLERRGSETESWRQVLVADLSRRSPASR